MKQFCFNFILVGYADSFTHAEQVNEMMKTNDLVSQMLQHCCGQAKEARIVHKIFLPHAATHAMIIVCPSV